MNFNISLDRVVPEPEFPRGTKNLEVDFLENSCKLSAIIAQNAYSSPISSLIDMYTESCVINVSTKIKFEYLE